MYIMLWNRLVTAIKKNKAEVKKKKGIKIELWKVRFVKKKKKQRGKGGNIGKKIYRTNSKMVDLNSTKLVIM